jgi:hypothetical protein
MTDINLTMGSDLVLGPTGDLSIVSGTLEGQQRVLRRLLTNPIDYIWHVDYGGALGSMVGKPTDALLIAGIIRGQLSKEAVVSQNPPPSIKVEVSVIGSVTVDIQYVDADTGQNVVLSLPPN